MLNGISGILSGRKRTRKFSISKQLTYLGGVGMRAYSDWKCGALTDDEYAFACQWEYGSDDEDLLFSLGPSDDENDDDEDDADFDDF